LIADDVAGIRYAMSGVDELQGTSDDYTIQLKYVGVDSNANIVVRFDHPLTAGGAAAASIATDLVSGNHRAMRTGRLINYKPNPPGGQTWTFPVPVSVPVVIEQVTGSEVALRLPTTDGERYLISWAPTLEASSWSTDLVELVVNGTSVGKTGANSFIFIADAVETTIALTFTGAPPDRGFFAAYVLEGRAFTPPPP
jgi:hypothetical protein